MNSKTVDGIIRLAGPTRIESEILGSHGLHLGWLMRDAAATFRDGMLSNYRLDTRVVFAECTGKPCVHLGYQTIPDIRYEVALASECLGHNELGGEQAKSACGRALTQLAARLEDPPLTNDYYIRFDNMEHGSEVLVSEILDAPTCGQYANAESTGGRPVDATAWATPGMTYRVDVGATKMPRAVAIPHTTPTLCCGDSVVFDTVKRALHRYRSVPFTDGDRVDPITATHSAAESALEHYVVVGTATAVEGDLPYEPSISATSRGAIFQYGNNLYILERRAEADTQR